MVADQKILDKDQYVVLMEKSKIVENDGPTIGKRHLQCILLFFLFFINYAMRVSMSVLVVAMTDSDVSSNKDIPTYNWTDKSLIMTSFMWGYMIPQIAAGYLATVYGAKWFLTGTVFFSSIAGFFIPFVAATLGSKGVMAIRIIQGLCQAFMFPSAHAFLGKWVPLQERSRLGTFPYLGCATGTVFSMLISGVISSSSYGWPMVLYGYGGIGIILSGILLFCCASEPDTHPSITEEEKSYIKNNLSETGAESRKDIPVPWWEIFTSLPFWALVVAQAGGSFGNWMLLFETPIYMSHVLKFDLKSNSLLSSLPYIADLSCAMVYSFIADYVIVKKIFSIGRTRKIMNAWAMMSIAIMMFLLAHCNSETPYRAVVYLALIGVTNGSTKSGFNVNHMDLSPNFSGVLMGIANCLGAGTGSLGPLLVHLVVKNEDDPVQWETIFYISAAIALVSLAFNVVFGSGSVQPWNEGSKKIRDNWQEVPLKE